MTLTCFSVPFTFRDGAAGAVSGFCPRQLRAEVETRFHLLNQECFGPATAGPDIDCRLTELLRQAVGPLACSLPLVAACVHRVAPDGPCGGVLGDLSAPDQRPCSRPPRLSLPTGQQCRLLLQSGVGAVAFFCASPTQEVQVEEILVRTFPSQSALSMLYQQCLGFLWVTDFEPGNPMLDGRCLVHLLADVEKEVPHVPATHSTAQLYPAIEAGCSAPPPRYPL